MFELLLSAKQMPGAGDRTLKNIDTASEFLICLERTDEKGDRNQNVRCASTGMLWYVML